MIFKTVTKAFKPIRLISLVMTYLLGAGLVQYVREMQGWSVFFEGLILLLLVTLSFEFLRLLPLIADPQTRPEGMQVNELRQTRWVIAVLAATFLTVATTLIVTWMQANILWQGLAFLLLAVLITSVLYYLSDMIDALKSFALLIEVLLFVVFPPAVGYFLHSDDAHYLLTMVVVGLVPAYLALRLLTLLQRYGQDQKSGKVTIVTIMGWERAMFLHNALILLTYLLYALIALLGFPWFLLWPVFLTLPIGLLEIWLMERVRRGMKPLWLIMKIAAACVLFIPIYLIGFAFWIR